MAKKNIPTGIARMVLAELGLMTDEAQKLCDDRMEICQQCSHITSLKRCTKCGCFLLAKTRVEDEKCPIGKW